MNILFPLPITAIFTGLLALMLVGFSVRITVLRAQKKIDLFDGGDKQLGRAIRAQGNFIEYVPMTLMLLALIEWMGARPGFLYVYGAALVLARIAHAYGLYSNTFPARAGGATLTWIVLTVGGLYALSAAG